MTDYLQEQYRASHLSGGNAAYVEELYEQWLDDPFAVPEHWQQVFSRLGAEAGDDTRHLAIAESFRGLKPAGAAAEDYKQAGVLRMINAYRVRGHKRAHLDPLGLSERPQVPDLELSFHSLSESDLRTSFHTGSLAAPDHLPLAEIIDICQKTYCGSIGVEYMHIGDTEQRQWLQRRLEGTRGNYTPPKEDRLRLLEKLTAAEGMEKYLHSKYVGQKRFSLEGGESMIPLFDALIRHTGSQGVREMVIGMAHRGRLNVLVNVLGKRPGDLFAEFEGVIAKDDPTRSGDVKYHMGFSSDVRTPGGVVHLALAFNPSHLEIVNPVVAGSARARQSRLGDHEHEQVMPVLVHGDAAIAGQGVVMELLNMSQARGFAVGGTFHIVVNNQVGFTTSNPLDARSTLYCTEVAKMVQAPILHVNGDDPEAVIYATLLAADFRREFKKDVVIDLVCYRRHGHNEADEPAATQPRMYQVIRKLDPVRKKYADRLMADGLIDKSKVEALQSEYRDKLDAGEPVVDLVPDEEALVTVDWQPYLDREWRQDVATGMSLDSIRSLSEQMTTIPEGFGLHKQVERIIESRQKMAAGEQPLDWGFAETMAYAGLITDGHGLRLVGQDSGRGTFFHRHAVLHNQNDGSNRVPLAELADDPKKVTIIDSLLSEEAVLGFEYGYATADPGTLVIWEAQFGDFVNGAQVVIDQFIASGEAKWGRLCGLVMFLPHGYEGQGPEHSSARLERFMQLCSGNNIQVCVPSLPSQMFHMLRRQMLRPFRKPLIVLTPKSLLRHKASTSSLSDLVDGQFQLVIDDPAKPEPSKTKRVVFCAGKVYFDLASERDEQGIDDIALVRVEQLYPFPREEVQAIVERYGKAEEVIWCQEEPMNQGAWFQIRHHLQACTGGKSLKYVGREGSSSPAVGYYQVHLEQQKKLVSQALTHGEGLA
ncbi:2-oxoglutarate dehydrogenase E1 component [Wenzhouxiangella marina]|uniref:2-oxoglutarate dehydrogenase E1 component n=1 Tax=Wenzhouxiangella marina TaxID=1579979 RepID=A0A0K0XWA6_9GAMM|nr:2-oxoglutarate dehydrogenase E1 component [Wenzhouxiangella marina]AKS41901.1 2-oxoglutarate dehydrogenase E1 component [Wenzhouxiangella marina]MBB6086332.1 2-oxoglutarate dehydrogenase E1 component [Wenzhouxiangella marina]